MINSSIWCSVHTSWQQESHFHCCSFLTQWNSSLMSTRCQQYKSSPEYVVRKFNWTQAAIVHWLKQKWNKHEVKNWKASVVDIKQLNIINSNGSIRNQNKQSFKNFSFQLIHHFFCEMSPAPIRDVGTQFLGLKRSLRPRVRTRRSTQKEPEPEPEPEGVQPQRSPAAAWETKPRPTLAHAL